MEITELPWYTYRNDERLQLFRRLLLDGGVPEELLQIPPGKGVSEYDDAYNIVPLTHRIHTPNPFNWSWYPEYSFVIPSTPLRAHPTGKNCPSRVEALVSVFLIYYPDRNRDLIKHRAQFILCHDNREVLWEDSHPRDDKPFSAFVQAKHWTCPVCLGTAKYEEGAL